MLAGDYVKCSLPFLVCVEFCKAAFCCYEDLTEGGGKLYLIQFYLGGKKSVMYFMLNKKKANLTRFLFITQGLPSVLYLIRAALVV